MAIYLPVFVSGSVQKNPHTQKICPAEGKCHRMELIPSQLGTSPKICVIFRYLQDFFYSKQEYYLYFYIKNLKL